MSLEPNSENSSHHSQNETPPQVTFAPLSDPEAMIKKNRMIVRIEYAHQHMLPQIYNEHTARKTYSVGWREYIVVLRRQRLEFFKSRNSRAEKVALTPSTRFSVFSAVDITLALTEQWNNEVRIVIFRPQTRALAVEWYAALRDLFPDAWPKSRPTSCEVFIPALNDVRITIPLPPECSLHGFKVDPVMEIVLDELRGVNEWDDALNELLKEDNLRLGWKHYDRIEWISPDWSNQDDLLSCPHFIEGTYQLQLRKAKHYPIQATKPDGTKFDEPVSIEGYLNFLSNSKGKKRKIPKRLYFTTHDHYMFYMKPKEVTLATGNSSSDLLRTFPPAHQHNENGVSSNEAEFQERFNQLKMTRGFFDLSNVIEVKSIGHREASEVPSPQTVEAIPPITTLGELNNAFQMVLSNGLSVILQADSPENVSEWINRLNDLVRYWHLRLSADVHIRLRVMNENRNIDDDHHDDENFGHPCAAIDSFSNGFRAFTDSTIWNWCVLEGCRSITLSGKLYHKSHYHGTFVNYQHILTRGHLIYYKLHSRSAMGKSKPSTSNKRLGIIKLQDCYVYSGSITEHDLLYHRRSSAVDPSLTDKLPRVYADGMHCRDEEKECTFVIWKSVKRRGFGKDEDMIMLKKSLQFGRAGNIWVFKARSRIEKLEWIMALNREIQRVWVANENHDG